MSDYHYYRPELAGVPIIACGEDESIVYWIGPDTPQGVVLSWALSGHPDAIDEWVRRRRAAEAAGIDPSSLDDEALDDDGILFD